MSHDDENVHLSPFGNVHGEEADFGAVRSLPGAATVRPDVVAAAESRAGGRSVFYEPGRDVPGRRMVAAPATRGVTGVLPKGGPYRILSDYTLRLTPDGATIMAATVQSGSAVTVLDYAWNGEWAFVRGWVVPNLSRRQVRGVYRQMDGWIPTSLINFAVKVITV